MELFFAEQSNIAENRIKLDAFEQKHLRQVLRKEPGDYVRITDGRGNCYTAELLALSPDITLSIIDHKKINRPFPQTAIACGFIKPNRLEILLEKGCELGVQEFYLVRTRYSNYYSPNVGRYNKVLRQALKQSRQFFLPQLYTFETIEEFVDFSDGSGLNFVALDHTKPALLEEIKNSGDKEKAKKIIIFVGPEGGFSEEETNYLSSHNFLPVSLGVNRLRTETAGIAGVSIIQMYVNQQKEMCLDT
jgi:16S rRNA (uracil1498-N3)-methyltransferase